MLLIYVVGIRLGVPICFFERVRELEVEILWLIKAHSLFKIHYLLIQWYGSSVSPSTLHLTANTWTVTENLFNHSVNLVSYPNPNIKIKRKYRYNIYSYDTSVNTGLLLLYTFHFQGRRLSRKKTAWQQTKMKWKKMKTNPHLIQIHNEITLFLELIDLIFL